MNIFSNVVPIIVLALYFLLTVQAVVILVTPLMAIVRGGAYGRAAALSTRACFIRRAGNLGYGATMWQKLME